MSNLAQNLRPAQIALLETIRPLEKWVCELSQYNENGDFWWIQESFASMTNTSHSTTSTMRESIELR